MRARIVRAGNEPAERPVSDAEWAFGDRLGRLIHGCSLIERSNNIKHIKDIKDIKDIRLRWTCHANRASMGSSPAPGLSAVAATTRPAPDQETTMTTTATAAHRPQRKARAHPLATLLAQREGASSAVLMSATGWQAVRGARAGALKRRGLLLTPEKRGRGRGRRYRSRGPR